MEPTASLASFVIVVRAVGFEPTWAKAPSILSALCKPFQHARLCREATHR